MYEKLALGETKQVDDRCKCSCYCCFDMIFYELLYDCNTTERLEEGKYT